MPIITGPPGRQANTPNGPAGAGEIHINGTSSGNVGNGVPATGGLAGVGNLNAGGASAVNLSTGIQHAGHQSDINHVWAVVEELTSLLAQNRAQTQSIISGVQHLQNRARRNGDTSISLAQVNGELSPTAHVELAELRSQLHQATKDHDVLVDELRAYSELIDTYELTFNTLMDKIREYTSENVNATVAIHRHYNDLLEQERKANLQLRVEHSEWQAGLGRAAEYARCALQESSDQDLPLESRNRELEAENRILRQLLGWKVEDSEDEDDRHAVRPGSAAAWSVSDF